jgi:predicted HicB family RNase H-like nuclease
MEKNNMAVRKKNLPILPENKLETKPVSLRLPGKMFDLAMQCGQASGLSLNGLVCTALADYLTQRGYDVHNSGKLK